MSYSWIEISKSALVNNIGQFRKIVGNKVKIMAVVKGNAYGHGIGLVAGVVDKVGVDWFGVDNIDEALALRNIGIKKPILVLGYVPKKDLNCAAQNNISLTVYTKEVITALGALTQKIGVHIKVETGTNRLGVKLSQLKIFVKELQEVPNIIIQGISTHFADIEDTLDPSFFQQQLANFEDAVKLLKSLGVSPPIKHTAASAAAIVYPKTYFDMIRLGISLYGLWPSRETKIAAKNKGVKIQLSPVLSWKSEIAQIKEIEVSESVSYGRTWVAARKTKITTVPIGYYDGFDRKFSNNGRVLVKDNFAPVVGRVMMNMAVVDVSDIKTVSVGDEVVLIGRQGNNEITVDELAQRIGTINYEVVSRLSPLIKRYIVS